MVRREYALSFLLAVLIVAGGLYGTGVFMGMAGGKSWTIGYYGEFNRARHAIEAMPSFAIVDSWQHDDVTLEDFSFTVVNPAAQQQRIMFWDDSPQQKLRNSADIQAFVRSQFSAPPPTSP